MFYLFEKGVFFLNIFLVRFMDLIVEMNGLKKLNVIFYIIHLSQ